MTQMTYSDGFRKISSAFSDARLLGGVTYTSSDELLLLTLLHLYKFHRFDGRLNQFQVDADIINALNEVCFDPSKEGSGKYAEVYDNIRPGLIRPEGNKLVNFLQSISCIPEGWYEEYFPQLFDDILFSLSEQLGLDGFFMQPKEFSELLFALVNLPRNAKVYDPFAGAASFAFGLPKDASFTGQEINGATYAIALLRLMAHGRMDFDLHNEDCFSHWRSRTYPDDEEIPNFDLIISFPPIGQRRDVREADLEYEWGGRQISLEEFFISNGQYGLSLGGQLAGIFSPSILYQGGVTGRFRENLIRSGQINTVIELPVGLLSMTSIGLCVIIFNNNQHKEDSIRFVDAKSFAERQGRKNVLKVEELLCAISSENPEFVKRASIDDVLRQGCILTPNRYFTKPEDQLQIPEGFELVSLGDIFCDYRGQMSQLDECRTIKGRNLASSDSFEPLEIANLEVEEVRNGRCRLLNDECLLVLRIGQLKPTLFKPDYNIPVTCNSNVTALKPKEEIFYPYIISELRKDYVKKQVEMRSVGVAMRSVSLGDLLGIKILLPCDRHLQQSSFENEQRLVREQKLKSLEIDEYLSAERNKVFEMMRIRKHRIKPYFSGMKSNLENILEEVEEKGALSLDYELDADYTILDAIRNIKNNLDEANRLFSVLTIETNIGEAEPLDLQKYLSDYTYNHTIPIVQFDIQRCCPAECPEFPEVLFNKENLKEVLDELIHNAEKHFAPGQKDAVVQLYSFVENGQYGLLICNNGQPLPEKFDVEKAFNPGYHMDEDGTGQGLFRVKQICDAFGAKLSLERDDSSPWVVNFYIYFKSV